MRKPAGLTITQTENKAQDGPFMMMRTGEEITQNKWESYRNKMLYQHKATHTVGCRSKQ